MKIQHALSGLSGLGALIFLTMAGTSPAADESEDRWRFGIGVPLWAPGIDGDVTVQGMTRDVHISFDQLKDHLDASFALALEAQKGKLGFYGGGGYLKFSADNDSGGTHASDELKFVLADAGMSYQLYQKGGGHPFVLQGTVGVRYWYTHNELTITGPFGGILFSASHPRWLVDPLIGLRAGQFLTAKLHVDFAGDVGGFDLTDHCGTVDWSATGVLTYEFARWFSLSAGYRAVGLDYERGNGANRNGLDITMHGLLIAAKLKF